MTGCRRDPESHIPDDRMVMVPRLAASPALLTMSSFQNNPTIRPSPSTSMLSAAGTFGKPGMVMISPQMTTTNSAPAERRTSRTGIVKSFGAPLRSGLVVKLY